MRAHRVRQARELLLLGIRPGPEQFVFADPAGAVLAPDRFSERFVRMVARHPELPPLRLHDLRHSHASIGLRAGVRLVVMSRRLGHSSIRITADIYAHLSPEQQSDAAEQISGLIFGDKKAL